MRTTFRSICAAICIGLFALPAIAAAQDTEAEPVSTEEAEPQQCAECHIDVVADWQDSAHANAYHSDGFQAALADGADDSCFACHTTGYQAFSGEFTHAGVTCEACHGVTPANHPDEAVAVPVGLEVCADCHTTTYQEWQVSAHGDASLECTSCHNPHPQQVRFGENNALCLNCHGDEELPGYAHVTHQEEECTSCHWHRGEFDSEQHILTGALMPTGHEGNVETLACIDCHEDIDEEYVQDTVPIEQAGLTSLVTVQELEAELESVRAQGQNTSAVRLMQGLVVGLAFGAVVTVGIVRLRPGRVKEKESDE